MRSLLYPAKESGVAPPVHRPFLWVPNGALACDVEDTPELHRLSEAGGTIGLALSETSRAQGWTAGERYGGASASMPDASASGSGDPAAGRTRLLLEGDIVDIAALLLELVDDPAVSKIWRKESQGEPHGRPAGRAATIDMEWSRDRSTKQQALALLSAVARQGWYDLVRWHRDWISSSIAHGVDST